eukprot:m.127563 g.127563  ORF g.127563 m.127563 type:complete len:333 (+) comp29282_c0_seq2:212-1210(+)
MPCGYLKNVKGVSRKRQRGGGSKFKHNKGFRYKYNRLVQINGKSDTDEVGVETLCETPRFGCSRTTTDGSENGVGCSQHDGLGGNTYTGLGLSPREIAALQHREISPEDYEFLLRLDETVKSKTVDRSVVDQLRVRLANKDDDETCCVCLAGIELGEKMKITDCDHHFHQTCIEKWLTSCSTSCPSCGQEVTAKSALTSKVSCTNVARDVPDNHLSSWVCVHCTYVNDTCFKNCDMCQNSKPSPAKITNNKHPTHTVDISTTLTPSPHTSSPTSPTPSSSPLVKRKPNEIIPTPAMKINCDIAEVIADVLFMKECIHLPQREKKRWRRCVNV